MPDDFYDSSEEESPKEDMTEGGEEEQKTALVPKSIFGGHKCKVGEVYKMKVEHIYGEDGGDEVELSYVGPMKGEGSDEEKPERGRMMREAEDRMGELTENAS